MLSIGLEKVAQQKQLVFAAQFFGGFVSDLLHGFTGSSDGIILQLQQQGGYQVERDMHLRKLLQQSHHTQVILQGVQTGPG